MPDQRTSAAVGTRVDELSPTKRTVVSFRADLEGFTSSAWKGGVAPGRLQLTARDADAVASWVLVACVAAFTLDSFDLFVGATGIASSAAALLSLPAVRDLWTNRRLRGSVHLVIHRFPIVAGRTFSGTLISPFSLVEMVKNADATIEHVYLQGDDSRRRYLGQSKLTVHKDGAYKVEHKLGAFALPVSGLIHDPMSGSAMEGYVTDKGSAVDDGSSMLGSAVQKGGGSIECKLELTLRYLGHDVVLEFGLPLVEAGPSRRWLISPEARSLPAPTLALGDGKALCPRCHTPTLEDEAGLAEGKGCSSCQGTFLSSSQAAAALEGLGVDMDMARELVEAVSGRGTQCPDCRREMSELPLKGVLIDLCTGCGGVWVDEGELESIERIRGTGR